MNSSPLKTRSSNFHPSLLMIIYNGIFILVPNLNVKNYVNQPGTYGGRNLPGSSNM